MANLEMLNAIIEESGMTKTFIAKKSNMTRQNLYNRLTNKSEFTISEVSNLSRTLGLTSKQKLEIFFD